MILRNIIALRYLLFLKLKETKSEPKYFTFTKTPTILLLGSFAIILGSEYITRVYGKREL